jgi:hypothetical protein
MVVLKGTVDEQKEMEGGPMQGDVRRTLTQSACVRPGGGATWVSRRFRVSPKRPATSPSTNLARSNTLLDHYV